jgi:pimeloyl-ACP methyl ester carboxylesterase
VAVLFVHGVPATSRLWRRVIELADRKDEVVAVDLPGMASPAPADWVSHKDNYVAWLIERIEDLAKRNGGPIHLVGHDWGCLLTLRAASLRPELLRSIAAGNAPIDPHWPLHAAWRIWLKPGIGERFMEEVIGPSTPRLTMMGFPPDDAAHCGFSTAEGRKAILDLYRSAPGVGREWLEDLARIVIPSMLIWGIRDHMVPVEIGRRMATRIGAELVELDSDHFWPYERPEEAVHALKRLWARTEAKSETVLTQNIEGMLASMK